MRQAGSARRAQRGVVLFIALIVLVAMSLAGIALMRNVDTGTVIAGNLAFRQNAVNVGDLGVEAARTWILAQNNTTLGSDNPGVAGGGGYFAQWAQNIDLVGNNPTNQSPPPAIYDWSNAIAVANPAPPAGFNVQYVIHRLCNSIGADTTASTCTRLPASLASSASGTKGAAAFGQQAIAVPLQAVYRVTARTTGPRNTVSFVQAVVF